MKSKQDSNIIPHLFGDHLILALSKDWINYFQEIPQFKTEIRDNKLVLTSQKRENP